MIKSVQEIRALRDIAKKDIGNMVDARLRSLEDEIGIKIGLVNITASSTKWGCGVDITLDWESKTID